ncbi:heme-binding protein 1-like [Portunus trituberculatus]|uniref:heme-binding protein 1-like n=1 Tax=Portunus trituberculatus TaxID=210409 RepID=UPI001E1CD49F|nr:heme-binding protein 1-like [Portunus trituberculatus]
MRLLTASFYLLAMQLVLLQVVETQIRENVSEIAPYTVVKEAQTYEERSYPSAHWICHNATLQDPSMSVDSFWPLFGYISGANIDGVSIPMTAPVTVRAEEDKQTGSWNTKMCFYLPEAHQENPPIPYNEDLQLVMRNAMNVFARRIGGNLTTEEWATFANDLKTTLATEEPTADLSAYYIVGYDSPSKATDRRNEVWFKKT